MNETIREIVRETAKPVEREHYKVYRGQKAVWVKTDAGYEKLLETRRPRLPHIGLLTAIQFAVRMRI